MPRHLTVAALGDVVRIDLSRLTDADARAVEDAWRDAPAASADAPGTTGEPETGIPTVVALDGAAQDVMLADLSQRVTLAAIEHARGRLWMLHAAGVALEDGRVVVFVGPSGRGKTTASRTLGRHFGYVSDETVAIAPDGAVLPYRKPLSVIESETGPKAQRAPTELELQPLPDAPLRLAAIILLDRRADGPDEPRVEPVDLGDALGDLVLQTSYLPALADPLRTIAAHAAAVGGIRRVVYREAASLVPLVRQLAEGGAPHLPPTPARRQGPAERELRGAVYRRTEVADAVDLDGSDRVALLHIDEAGQGTVRVIAGIAPTVWRTADGATIAQLTAAAVDAHGAPDGADPVALVAAAADELVSAGVLTYQERVEWAVTDAVAWVDSGDRAVVLDLDDRAVAPKALEGSAALIWFALVEGGTADEIVARVADEAGEDPERIEADVIAFLSGLREDGWIVPVAPDGTAAA